MPLGWQIIVPAVLGSALFLAVLGGVSFQVGQQALTRQVEQRNIELARLYAEDIAAFFQTLLDTTRLQEQALVDTTDPEGQAEALAALRRVFPQTYSRMWLVNDAGEVLLALEPSTSPEETFSVTRYDTPQVITFDASVSEGLQQRTFTVSDTSFQPLTGWPFVTATFPLNADSDISGLVVEIDLRSFWLPIDRTNIEAGSVSIIDSNGAMLANNNRERVGEQLDIAAIAPVFDGFEASTSYTRDGASYLAAYSPVGGALNWGVVVEQQRTVALAPVGTIALVTVLVAALSALGVALLLAWLTRRAVRPVSQLSTLASTIASQGDLQPSDTQAARVLAADATSAEVQTLARSFAGMVAGLEAAQARQRRWNEELEQRVAERTTQLETVLDIARLSGGSLRERDVLSTLLEQIGRLVQYDSATIMLLDHAGTRLETMVTRNQHGTLWRPRHTISVDTYPLNRYVLEQGSPVLIPDTSREPRWQGDYGHASWLAAPLLARDRAVGVIGLTAYRPEAFNAEDANMLAALASHVGILLEHARLFEESVQRVEQELEQAEQIQRHLFPNPPAVVGLDVAAFYRPARETTGDFYEFVSPPSTHNGDTPAQLGVILGDVSGKSLPAALLMAVARTALRSAARVAADDPLEVMTLANQALVGNMPRGSFVAASYAYFDSHALRLDIINAAQPFPLLVRDGGAHLLAGEGGHFPLGITIKTGYCTASVPLQPRDVLLFYTDGVVEARNHTGELFGFERLMATLCELAAAPTMPPAMIADVLLQHVDAWLAGAPQNDDIAIIVVQVTAHGLGSSGVAVPVALQQAL